MNVVFTGPAIDGYRHSVVRADLISACAHKGNLHVQSSVRGDTDVLVASRTDTVKAKAAHARGIAVFTYPEFISRFMGSVELKRGSKPNHYVDAVDLDLLVPDFGGSRRICSHCCDRDSAIECCVQLQTA
jgi:hypothetical protein